MCLHCLHSFYCQCPPRGCQWACTKSSRPFPYLTESGQHLTRLITSCFLNCTSLALLWLVVLLPLWLFLSASCAGFSTRPMHNGVSQGSVAGSLGKPIHAIGFKDSAKESRVDLQPQHPSYLSEPQFAAFCMHRQFEFMAQMALVAVLCKPAPFGCLP